MEKSVLTQVGYSGIRIMTFFLIKRIYSRLFNEAGGVLHYLTLDVRKLANIFLKIMEYRGVVETLYGICMKDLGNTTKSFICQYCVIHSMH
jgi:hypothetical protein